MSIHKPLIAIVGPSGSGKSTSLKGLNPAEVKILDGERKGFPFKGAEKYDIRPFESKADFDKVFEQTLKEEPKYIVVESLTKLALYIKSLCVNAYKGYDVWSNYSKMVRQVITKAKNTKTTVIFTAIDEIVEIGQPDGSTVSKRMIGVEGQELKKQGGIEPDMLVIFFTNVAKTPQGIAYQFETNNDGVTTAKSPMDMFPRFIPNDLATALKKMEEYYS